MQGESDGGTQPYKPLSFFYRAVIYVYEPDLVVLHSQRKKDEKQD